jgi:chemotaxis methyl-accepting protein methylase
MAEGMRFEHKKCFRGKQGTSIASWADLAGDVNMTYDNFLKVVGELFDLDWRKYRRRSARRQVEKRLRELGFSNYSQYLERLRADPEEARKLPDLMRITVSRFFREKTCWWELAEILPELLKGKDRGVPLRAWCAGCCNGEEAYSLAILFLWTFGSTMNVDGTGIDILATDIDEKVLTRAHVGCYDQRTLREVPTEILARFFNQSGRQSCVDESIRNVVRFKRHNLTEDASPAGMDLVLCRYLAFTYYRGQRRRQAAERLWAAMKPGAALMIGRKEELGPLEEEMFEGWLGAKVVFRKRI